MRIAGTGAPGHGELGRQPQLRPAAPTSPSAPPSASGARRCSRSTIPERPGSYRAFIQTIGPRPRHRVQLSPRRKRKRRMCFVGVQLAGGSAEKGEIAASLRAGRLCGFSTCPDDETAKVHIRYMVGGRAQGLPDERLYRFQFPERPGALLKFPRRARRWLEHQPLSLPQPWRRLTAACSPASSSRRRDGHALSCLPRRARLSLLGTRAATRPTRSS